MRCLILANMIEMWDVLRIMVPFSGLSITRILVIWGVGGRDHVCVNSSEIRVEPQRPTMIAFPTYPNGPQNNCS